MPDASDPRDRAPLDWGDAFAALPPETPPADAWSRVSARLDARATAAAATAAPAAPRRGARRPVRRAGWLGAAAAAALVLAVAWPGRAPQPAAPAPLPSGAPSGMRSGADDAPASPARPAPDDALAAGTNAPRRDATTIALPKAVETARKPRLAATDPAPAHGTAPAPERLDALYAESARLEALLDLARDERVASASALLLASEFDARVAAIDARLAQPGLDDAQRTSLWQARVDALRQAAGFESTQRMLASQGAGGTLLVSVD